MELLEGKMDEASDSATVSTRLQRIAELAKRAPQMSFTTLAHHLDIHWMREAYRLTRKNGAAGVDGVTAKDYERELDSNLASLLERLKAGTYRAPPVRRVHIPKGSGKETRPIGIPTLEDKVAQRAIAMLMEAVYEQDFLDCSYGFRPKRSPLGAVARLREHLMELKGGVVLEIDFRKFFDTLDHGHIRSIVSQRVRDGVVTRLIGKWLNAGVMEDGRLSIPEAGTPQGGVISPLLANIYLHTVLDTWFAEEVRPRLSGRAYLVRFADDAVMVFECEHDARRVMEVLPKRCGKYGLTLHPEKTKLVQFRRPPFNQEKRNPVGKRRWTSFDMLGFTHYWARSRRGNWVVFRKTAKNRLARTIKSLGQWLRSNRHRPIREQHHVLCKKLEGHFSFFGIVGNSRQVWRVWQAVIYAWRKWLSRRSQSGSVSWAKMKRLLERFPLPKPGRYKLA